MSCFPPHPATPAGMTRFASRLLAATVSAVTAAAFFMAAPVAALAQAPQFHPPVVAPNSTLSGVTYNNRYEVYGGAAYTHFDAGPSLLQGANLGGLDIQGSYFFTHKWAADGNVRAYYGTSGAIPNPYGINGPAVSEYSILAGPQYRLVANPHASISLHALFGGTYGYFSSGLGGISRGGVHVEPGNIGFYNDQIAFGSAIGGSIDLNRSPRLAFRISPDANLSNFSSGGKSDFKEQFALSVGLVYRLGKHIDPDRPGAPAPPVK